MALKIIVVGKTKPAWAVAACESYLERLQKFTKVDYVEIKKASHRHTGRVAEGEKILSELPGRCTLYALDERGRQPTSPDLARAISSDLTSGMIPTFVIGGAHGLSPHVLSRAGQTISFSKLTLPHQLVRILLLEQLYRAFTIMNGEKYHK